MDKLPKDLSELKGLLGFIAGGFVLTGFVSALSLSKGSLDITKGKTQIYLELSDLGNPRIDETLQVKDTNTHAGDKQKKKKEKRTQKKIGGGEWDDPKIRYNTD